VKSIRRDSCTNKQRDKKEEEEKMQQATKIEVTKKEKIAFEILSLEDLNFIRGGDQPNATNGDDED
jgi:hypothetical protein